MRVVGASGVIMDMPAHVATGMLASGIVTRVTEAATEEGGAPAQPAAVVPPTEPTGGPETAAEGDGGTIPAGDTDAAEDDGAGLPRGNASREVWVEFALLNGKTEDDLNGLTQTEIRELFKPASE